MVNRPAVQVRAGSRNRLPSALTVTAALLIVWGGVQSSSLGQVPADVFRTMESVVLQVIPLDGPSASQASSGLVLHRFVANEALAATAHDAIQGAERLTVADATGRRSLARVVHRDRATGVGILWVTDWRGRPLAEADLKERALRQGENLVVLGFDRGSSDFRFVPTKAAGPGRLEARVPSGFEGGPVVSLVDQGVLGIVRSTTGTVIPSASVLAALSAAAGTLQAAQAPPSPTPQPTVLPPPSPAASPSPPQQTAAANLIQPGVGIGLLTLGMSEEDAIRVMGPPLRRQTAPSPATIWRAPGYSLPGAGAPELFAFTDQGRIYELLSWGSTSFRTPAGNAIGSAPAAFLAEFGRETREADNIGGHRQLAFDGHGVAIRYDSGGVVGVYVFRPLMPRGLPISLGPAILPGNHIGGIALRNTIVQTRILLGQNDRESMTTDGNQVYQWWLLGGRFKGYWNLRPHLNVFARPSTGQIIAVQIASEGVRTPRGNQVGMHLEAFFAEFGEPSATGRWVWLEGATTADFDRFGVHLAYVQLSSGVRQVVMIGVY